MLVLSVGIGLGIAAGAIAAALVYFARVTLPRPPGVFGLADVAAMMLAIIVLPHLYLALPAWSIDVVLVAGGASLVALTAEPLGARPWAAWSGAFALAGLDVWLARRYGTLSMPFLLLNNSLLVMCVVGAANVWTQAGLSARNLAVLAILLAVYDVCFTCLLPVMSEMLDRVAELPLGPIVRWPLGVAARWIGVGLGDLVLMTVAPLVFWKAYGRAACRVAVAVSLMTVAVALLLVLGEDWTRPLPLMAIFGPATALEYLWWRNGKATERTTRAFRRAGDRRGGAPA